VRLLLDMNVSPAISEGLRAESHDVVQGRDFGLAGVPDTDVFAKAAADKRVLVTFDLDFGDVAATAADTRAGVLLLRLRSPRRAFVSERILAAIRVSAGALAAGAIVLVEDARIRIRQLP
jgi:predicted nuclease of predicted toxin-antitoxin system